VTRLRSLGWAPQVSLGEGIESTYDWYVRTHAAGGCRRLRRDDLG
jgi:nucleoside-diphosphate-sugar epimerase